MKKKQGKIDYVLADYVTKGNPDYISEKIDAFTHECGVGSWTDLPFQEEAAEIGPIYMSSKKIKYNNKHTNIFRFRICFPIKILGNSISELLLFLMGGVSGLKYLQLVDLEIPIEYAKRIQGQAPFNGDFVNRLYYSKRRPLIQGIIKPCFGLKDQQILQIVGGMIRGGVDLIKDDELASHDDFNSQIRRVELIRETIEKLTSNAGIAPFYFAQLSGPVESLIERAHALKRAGADGILLSPYALGYDIITLIRKNSDLPIETHPSCSGIYYSGEGAKISPEIVLGLFPRLAGANLSMFFAPEGKFRLSWKNCKSIVAQLEKRNIFLHETLPVVAGGIYPAQIPILCNKLGPRLVVAAGGAIVGHPKGPEAGTLAMRQAVERSMDFSLNISKIPQELKVANTKWSYNENESLYSIRN